MKERVKVMMNMIWSFIKQHVVLVSSASAAVVSSIAIAVLCFNMPNAKAIPAANTEGTTTAAATTATTIETTVTETTTTTEATTTTEVVTETTEVTTTTAAPARTTTAAPVPVETAAPTDAPTEAPTAAPPIVTPVVNDGWSYPYNLEVIYADCKAYALSIGLDWGDEMAKDNASWFTPRSTVPYTEGEMQIYNISLKQKLYEDIVAIKNEGNTAVKIYFETRTDYPGDYWIYEFTA